MADEKKPEQSPGLVRGWMKGILGLVGGVGAGVFGMYANALVNTVVKPSLPVANFAVAADGLSITVQNQATGDSGWWDFGDGSPLEPFDPNQPKVAHTYTKPGDYTVKLTVRNFLMEENNRSVPVDLTGAAPAALPPSVTGLTVEPIGGPRPVAPAAFRVRGEVKNAEKVLLDLGEKVEVSTENGQFERLVVFEKPGQFPVALTGLTGTQVEKKSQIVTVAAASVGSLFVVMRVSDTVARVEHRDSIVSVALPLPAKGAKAAMEKMVFADPGHTLTEVKIGKVTSPAIRNLKAEMTPDKKAVKLTGEWTAVGDGATKAAGGSDVIVPLTLVQQRTASHRGPSDAYSAALPLGGVATLSPKSHALGAAGVQRRTAIEIRQSQTDGSAAMIVADNDVKFPWTKQVAAGVSSLVFRAEQVGNDVRVTVTQQPAR